MSWFKLCMLFKCQVDFRSKSVSVSCRNIETGSANRQYPQQMAPTWQTYSTNITLVSD